MAVERIDGCTGCGKCVEACPMDVFRMDEQTNKAVIKYPEDCQICHQCQLYCPVEDAITITPEKYSPLTVAWG